MSVSYTKKQRALAKKKAKHLITIDTPGICYQGLADTATTKKLMNWLLVNIIEKGKA